MTITSRIINWRNTALLGMAVMLMIVLLNACGGDTASGKPEKAKDFTLKNLAGEEVSLSRFQGQPVMINFWASWCNPCRDELPLIETMYEKFQDQGFVVVAVNSGESAGAVQAFATEQGLTFPILLDEDMKITALYRVRGLPVSVFVDTQGMITNQHVGMLEEKNLGDYLKEIIQ